MAERGVVINAVQWMDHPRPELGLRRVRLDVDLHGQRAIVDAEFLVFGQRRHLDMDMMRQIMEEPIIEVEVDFEGLNRFLNGAPPASHKKTREPRHARKSGALANKQED
jgi:hypothetical protein